ncbi:MAG: type II secretion system F family protein [Chloroflexota bacterium]|nr:type II secretion system F family protein [Chloroflexota bacterium]
MLWLALAALAVVGLGTLVGGVVMSRRGDSDLIEERLGLEDRRGARREPEYERPAPLTDALDRALAERGIGDDLATQLARANLKLTVGEFAALTVILVVLAAGLSFMWKRDVIVTAVACLAAFFAPRAYVGLRRGRRLKAFNQQLGDTINLMVNSIRAGYSILQAMRAVSDEMAAPISTEFGRVVQEVQLGIPVDEALDHMLRRVPSEDLDMMITAINIQREVGGNLAEVLESISFTIRERIRIKGEIVALTAQSRISGYMVAIVPVVLAGIIYLISPEFMGLLFEHTCGHIMIGVAAVGIGAGFFVISKILDIDV